jgi:hypothetical protein
MSATIKNTSDLRGILLDAIENVRNGKLGAKEASAISSLSNQVLESAKLDIRVSQLRDRLGGVADRPASLLPDAPTKGKK